MLIFSKLWAAHPSAQGKDPAPCKSKGRSAFDNQCSIRLGTAFKACGVTPSDIRHKDDKKKPVFCWFHEPSSLHVIRAEEMAAAIRPSGLEGLGAREKLSDPSSFDAEITGRTGIVFFKDYWARDDEKFESRTGDHIDLWNGNDTAATSTVSEGVREGMMLKYKKSKEIWFWEVK